jgi:hypothetical protein
VDAFNFNKSRPKVYSESAVASDAMFCYLSSGGKFWLQEAIMGSMFSFWKTIVLSPTLKSVGYSVV